MLDVRCLRLGAPSFSNLLGHGEIEMSKTKEKQLGLAIGLNLLLAGAGYMYMGKWIVGIFAFLLIVGIYATTGVGGFGSAWLVMNVIMGIDMYILFKKNKEKFEQENTKKCPNCAESVQIDAKVCRYCNSSFEEN